MSESSESPIKKPLFTRLHKSIQTKVSFVVDSILTAYRRIRLAQYAKKILKRFTKEEFLVIGTQIMGEHSNKADVLYSILSGAVKMGKFFDNKIISPFNKHMSPQEYREMKTLLHFLEESLFMDFKKIPLLVNNEDVKKEAQDIYRARLVIGR